MQELLDAAVDRMCRSYPAEDPAELSGRAGRYLRYVTGLPGGRMTLAQHRELLVIAGWLAALIACACCDAGDKHAAEAARVMTAQFGVQACRRRASSPGHSRSLRTSLWRKAATATR